MLVAAMLAIGMSVQAKEEVTDQYLTNADLYSLDGWDQHGYTAWKTDGAVPVIEFWNWSNSFSFTQTITLPKGNYRLAVNSFYRESWGGNGTNNNMAWIFAGEKKQNVIALNSMADLSGYAGGNDLYRAATAFSQGKFSNEFDFSINADNTDITLGFEGTTPNGGWCILGPVKLYQYTLEDYLVDYRAKVAEAEPYLTEKMSAATLAALNAAIVEESTLTSADEIALAIQNLNEAITAAKASIAAYEKLKAAIDKGEVFITTSIEYGAPESCKSALDGMKAAYNNGTIADADIDMAIAEIQAILIIVAKQQTKSGADMTPLLTNPDFELNPSVAEGWTIDVPDYGGYGNAIVGGNDFNHCFEAFSNPGFDVYQTVENTPYGVYEIQVQGFYRYLRDNAAWNAYQAQEVDYVKKQGVPVYIYMNDNATPFTNVFDVDPIPNGELYTTDPALLNPGNTPPYVEPSGQYWYPNDMYNAAVAFSQGMYRQSAFGLVAFDGDILRLGVKGVSNQGGDSWVIWDDFKLIYRGFQPDIIKPVLEEAVKDVEDTYIGLLMGKTEYAAFTDALALAENAIAENDGENMFKALRDLYAAKDPALTSKDIFLSQEVAADTTRLAEAIRDVANKKLANSTRARANTLLNGLKNNLIYENDQIDQLKQDVTNMIDALNNSVILYSELDGLCNNFSGVITNAKEQGASVALIASAEELLADTRLGWNEASIEDEDIPTIEENIRNLMAALNTSVNGYNDIESLCAELEDAISDAITAGISADGSGSASQALSNAQGALNAAQDALGKGTIENADINNLKIQLRNIIDKLKEETQKVATSISSASTNLPAKTTMYNMKGMKANATDKGILLHHGKKVVVK